MAKLDSNDFVEGRFSPHGRLTAWPEDNILRFDVTGPLNVETISALGRLRKKLYDQFSPADKSFCVLAVFQVSMLMPREAVDLFQRDLLTAYKDQARSPAAVAWVAGDDVEGGALIFRFVKKIHDDIGTPCELFKDVPSAEQWLCNHLQST